MKRAVATSIVCVGKGVECLSQYLLKDDRAQILERAPFQFVQIVVEGVHLLIVTPPWPEAAAATPNAGLARASGERPQAACARPRDARTRSLFGLIPCLVR